MTRRKKTMGAYRATPIHRKVGQMAETVEGVKGHERYEREFKGRGVLRWEMMQEITQPYISGIKTRPDLSPEQKAVAVKEFFRRTFGEERGLEAFFMSVMQASISHSIAMIPVAVMPRPRY